MTYICWLHAVSLAAVVTLMGGNFSRTSFARLANSKTDACMQLGEAPVSYNALTILSPTCTLIMGRSDVVGMAVEEEETQELGTDCVFISLTQTLFTT